MFVLLRFAIALLAAALLQGCSATLEIQPVEHSQPREHIDAVLVVGYFDRYVSPRYVEAIRKAFVAEFAKGEIKAHLASPLDRTNEEFQQSVRDHADKVGAQAVLLFEPLSIARDVARNTQHAKFDARLVDLRTGKTLWRGVVAWTPGGSFGTSMDERARDLASGIVLALQHDQVLSRVARPSRNGQDV